MTIPTYTVIADAEIDPEAPLTSSLFYRLRNNVCALLNVDPSDTNPSVSFQASRLAVSLSGVITMDGNPAYTIASNELQIATIGNSFEYITVQPITLDVGPSGVGSAGSFATFMQTAGYGGVYTPMTGHLFSDTSGAGSPTKPTFAVLSLELIYSGLVPTSLVMRLRDYTGTVTSTSLPIDNVYHNIGTNGTNCTWKAKVRATATQVFLQLQIDSNLYSGTFVHVELPIVTYKYASKA